MTKEKIIINNYIQGEPLAEENLDDVLNLVIEINKRYNNIQYIEHNNSKMCNISNKNADEIRLSFPKKLYGYIVDIRLKNVILY